MLLGILSDTHEHLENIEKARKIFAERGASPVIHLGDYCAGPSVRAMQGMKVIGILGNNDGDVLRIQRCFHEIDGEFRWQFCVLEFDGLKIACYHGTENEITEALVLCGKYDVVLSGHTHHSSLQTVGKTLALNPGSAHGFEEEAPMIAVLDTETKKAEIIPLFS